MNKLMYVCMQACVCVFGNIEFVMMKKKIGEKVKRMHRRICAGELNKTKRIQKKEYLHTCQNNGE